MQLYIYIYDSKKTTLHASSKIEKIGKEGRCCSDTCRDIFLTYLLSLLSFGDLHCGLQLTAVVEYTFVIEGTKNPQRVPGLGVIKQTAELRTD